MLPVPAQSTPVPASADDHEIALPWADRSSGREGLPTMNGLLVLGELPAGVVGVTTVSALLSRISGSTQVRFGDYLRDLCDDLAGTSGRSGGPSSPVLRPTKRFRSARGPSSRSSSTCSSPTRLSMRSRRGAAAGSPCPSRPIRRPGSSPSTIAASPSDPTVIRATMAWRSRGYSSCGSADSWRSRA